MSDKCNDMDNISINKCVESALENNSHEDFFQLLSDLIKEDKCFTVLFNKELEKHMCMSGIECESIQDKVDYIDSLQFVKPELWKTCSYHLEEGKDKFQKQTIKKWLEGSAVPKREVIIQLCLWMTCSYEQTNRLLMAAGHWSLYHLDIFDVVSIFYLNKYASENSISLEQFTGVKEMINRLSLCIVKITADGTDKRIDFSGKKESRMPGYYDKRIGYELENALHKFEEGQGTNGVRTHMTKYMSNWFEEKVTTEKELVQFVEDYSFLFGEIHFGIHQTIQKYLDTTEYYIKNVYNCDGKFLVSNGGKMVEKPRWSKDTEWIIGVGEMPRPWSSSSKRNIVTMLLSANDSSIKERVIEEKRAGKFSTLSSLLDGRTRKPFYQYEHPKKVTIIRLLIAMGREDEIGKTLVRAGYWLDDYIMDSDDELPYLDITDYMIIYMVRFKDRLMECWAENKKKTPTNYLNEYRKNFPFLKMSIEISYGILKYFKSNVKDIYSYKEIEKYLFVYHSKKNHSQDS